jgi:hypothetical protein
MNNLSILKLHAIRFATEIIQMRRDIEYNPRKYLSNISGGVQASASRPTDPHALKRFSYIFSPGGIVYVSALLGVSRSMVGSNESCDRAVKLVDSWELVYVLFNKLDGQSYW